MPRCLALTGLTEFWESSGKLLLLGPWCAATSQQQAMLEGRDYEYVSSPWSTVESRRAAGEYCWDVYERVLKELTSRLNRVHGVSYPDKYWRILIGPWLIHFIESLYDRYARLKKTAEVTPDFFSIIPADYEADWTPLDSEDFFAQVSGTKNDLFNLYLMGRMLGHLYPDKIYLRGIAKITDIKHREGLYRHASLKAFFYKILERKFSYCPLILADMHHLSIADKAQLSVKTGLNLIDWYEADRKKMLIPEIREDLREGLHLADVTDGCDDFIKILFSFIPKAIPISLVEHYEDYRSRVRRNRDFKNIKFVGSAVGWIYNEEFKYLAAEAVAFGAKTVEFQHGGGFGQYYYLTIERISLEKDVFFSWGWHTEGKITRPLPSPLLSKRKGSLSLKTDRIVFVGIAYSHYVYRFITWLYPEDMEKYFQDKKTFFVNLNSYVKDKLIYRPYDGNYWDEKRRVKEIFGSTEIVSGGSLANILHSARLALMDHPSTGMLEALTINVPCVFFWDHDIYRMRTEAEPFFEKLREAEILFTSPVDAAKKVNEIWDDPSRWWRDEKRQTARNQFCEQFAFSRYDWMNYWVKNLKELVNK